MARRPGPSSRTGRQKWGVRVTPGIFGCIFTHSPRAPAGPRTARLPQVMVPRSVCSSPQPLGTSNKRTFLQTFLSGHFAGFLKSLAPSSQNLHSISREAGAGDRGSGAGEVHGGKDPQSFQAVPESRGARGGDQFPRSPMHASSLPSPFPIGPSRRRSKTLGRVNKLGNVFSGLRGSTKRQYLRSHPGTSGVTSARELFCGKERGEGVERIYPLDPRGIPAIRLAAGDWVGGIPQGALPDSPQGLPDSARPPHLKRRATPARPNSPELGGHAGHQDPGQAGSKRATYSSGTGQPSCPLATRRTRSFSPQRPALLSTRRSGAELPQRPRFRGLDGTQGSGLGSARFLRLRPGTAAPSHCWLLHSRGRIVAPGGRAAPEALVALLWFYSSADSFPVSLLRFTDSFEE